MTTQSSNYFFVVEIPIFLPHVIPNYLPLLTLVQSLLRPCGVLVLSPTWDALTPEPAWLTFETLIYLWPSLFKLPQPYNYVLPRCLPLYDNTQFSVYCLFSPADSSLEAGILTDSLLWPVPRRVGFNKDCFSKQSNDLESNPCWKGKMV